MQATYKINPRQVFLILAVIAIILTAQSLFTEYLIENTSLKDQSDSITVLVLDLFSVNLEESIPTWFATIILFVASILLWLIALSKRKGNDPFSLYWLGLAIIFMYLSMDEGAVIHEIIAEPLQQKFNTTGFFYFGWQLVAIPLLVIFVLLYARFLLALPRKFALLFVISGAIYVGGAIVVEGISASQWYDQGQTMTYLAIATVEECFEMLGVVVFIYTLLSYMVEMNYTFTWDANRLDVVDNEQVERLTPRDSIVRMGAALIAILLILNLAGLIWITQRDEGSSEPGDTQTAQEQLLESLETDDVFVVEMNGIFSFDNVPVQQTVITLLPYYDDIIVLSLVPSDSSLVFAADDLPFDQNSLTELLHTIGETQFIIFDTPLLQTLAPQLQSSQ